MRHAVAGGGDLVRTARSLLAAATASLLVGVIVAEAMSGVGPNALRLSGVFIALGAVVVALRADRWAFGAVALLAAWWAAVVAARYLPDLINPSPPVGQAVGAAALFNTPYRGAQIGAVVSVVVPTLLALAAVAIPRLRIFPPHRRPAPKELTVAVRVERTSPRSVAMWVGAAVLAFTLVPDLKMYVEHAGDPLPYSWDLSNVIAWQGLVDQGLVPMKDFFYPYGFQWLYNLRSFGPLFAWLAEVAMLALSGWSLWRLTGRRTWRVLACLLAVLLLASWAEAWRYLPPFLVATTYAALGPARHSRLVPGHLALFAACLLTMLLEPDLLAYGVVGMLLVLVGEIVGERGSWRPCRLAVGVVLDVVPVLAAVAVNLLVWLAMGTAAGNLRFFGDLTAVSAQAATNERTFGPLGLMVLHPSTSLLYAAVPALLATAGFLWARVGRRDQPGVAAILLGASGVSLVLLLKHFVRPIGDEMIAIPMIALSWSVILVWRRDSMVRAAACGAALAALLTVVDRNGGLSPSQYLSSAVASPSRAVRSVLVTFDLGARVRGAHARLDPGRFVGWPDTAIATDYLETVHAPPVPPFAIVGDSQLTYVLLRQPPPYEVTLYDASPLAEQRAMVRLLEHRRPAFVIWRRDFSQDGVPYQVRDPIVFDWMVMNYVPVRPFPNVDMLRRRLPGEPPAAGFWRSRLGAAEDLGYIPSFSDAASSPSCSAGPGCVRYSLMHGHAAGEGAAVSFAVSGNGATYTVTFRTRGGVEDYPMRLDRLWFWPLVGRTASLASLTPGFTARGVALRSGDNLY